MINGSFELDEHLPRNSIELFYQSKQLSSEVFTLNKSFNKKLNLSNNGITKDCIKQAESFHALYRAQAHERLEKLQSAYAELGKPDHLIVMLISEGYLSFFENWLL